MDADGEREDPYQEVRTDLLNYLVAVRLAKHEIESNLEETGRSRLSSLVEWLNVREKEARFRPEGDYPVQLLSLLREFIVCALALHEVGSAKTLSLLQYIEESTATVLDAWEGEKPLEEVQRRLDSISDYYWGNRVA
ncbi:MAG: hypothetical protein QW767_02705 [Thermoprotei archaeon]